MVFAVLDYWWGVILFDFSVQVGSQTHSNGDSIFLIFDYGSFRKYLKILDEFILEILPDGSFGHFKEV